MSNRGVILFKVGLALSVLKLICLPLLASAPWWLVTLPMWIGIAAGVLLMSCIVTAYALLFFIGKVYT